MEEVLKADIFFFVTTIAVVVLSTLLAIVVGLAIKVLRDIGEIARMTKEEAHNIRDDISLIRHDIREGVHEAKENIAKATSYTKTIAGSFGVREALSFLFHTLTDSRKRSNERTRRKGKSDVE